MIKQPWNKFGQNTSVAPSRSSKTIRSKFVVNNEQDNRPIPLYFKDDPMREQIILRARKQTNKISPQPKIQDRLGKISKMVQNLHKRREQTKKRLQNLKQQAEDQMQKICSFTPQKKKVSKYVVTGDVIRRNQVWMQQKTRKHLYLKQQRTLQQLKQCTFSPSISSKKQSQMYLKNKTGKSLTPKKTLANYETGTSVYNFHSPIKNRKNDISTQQYQTAKKYLVSRIMNPHIL